MYPRRKNNSKIVRFVVYFVIFLASWILLSQLFRPFTVPSDITIKQGDGFSSFYRGLSSWDTFRVKRYIKRNVVHTKGLEVGHYAFSGSYTPSSYVQTILDGSEKSFRRVTILEGRSVYDIDQYLSQQFAIQSGSYVTYVTDDVRIASLQSTYGFLQEAGSLSSLEGFLYPETYFIDNDADVVSSLVRVQLDTFDTRVRSIIQSDLGQFYERMARDYPRVSFDRHAIITLASVVQKEERIFANQPTIAGLFLHRLQIGMRLDADITLCYGLHQPYSVCTPAYISQYVSDDTNVFNTRRKGGLPPQAIANVPVTAIQAVLGYKNSNYLYYLHDANGRIYYGTTLEQHNSNKQQYLR